MAYHSAARRYVDGLVQAGQLTAAEMSAPRKACTLSGEAKPAHAAVREPETADARGWRWRELLAAGRHPCEW
jgi:hypothetical protein